MSERLRNEPRTHEQFEEALGHRSAHHPKTI